MSANDRQVGGSHYKTPGKVEHWDIVAQHGLDYFQGQITKYVMRWKLKGGVGDLEKAKHFLEKYLELQYQGQSEAKEAFIRTREQVQGTLGAGQNAAGATRPPNAAEIRREAEIQMGQGRANAAGQIDPDRFRPYQSGPHPEQIER